MSNVVQLLRQRLTEAGPWDLLNFKEINYTDESGRTLLFQRDAAQMHKPFLHFAPSLNNLSCELIFPAQHTKNQSKLERRLGRTHGKMESTKGDAPVLGTTEASMSKTTKRYQHARF